MTVSKLVVLVLLVVCIQSATNMTFDEFITKFNKPYAKDSEEYKAKKLIFQQNLKQLNAQNCEACGVTKFFDVSKDDFKKRTFTLQIPDQPVQGKPEEATKIIQNANLNKLSAPRYIDWRERGIITSIKEQGDCGCCWSFATIALAESNLILKGLATRNVDLSQQYLLKCTPDGDCDGGYIQNAIKVISAKGAPQQSKYPYTPFKSSPGICDGTSNIMITNKRPMSMYSLSDEEIKSLLTTGPLAIAIDSTDWQYYTGGIWKCNPNNDVNHAVLLVGYTEDQRAWIVKNQWGADWGENGYIYVSTARGYNCKIGTAVHMLNQFYFKNLALLALLLLAFFF